MSLWNNIRFALRLLRKSPAFTITVLATLGLCIGANTAIYSVVDAIFFRPLPYPQPDRLVMIARKVSGNGNENLNTGQDGHDWELIHANATDLDTAVYGDNGGVNLYVNGRTAYVQQQRVGAGFFHVLGIKPLLGREFKPSEDVPGGPALTVLSYSAWQHFFKGDPSVVGQSVDLRGAPFTVVGVMPRGFHTDAPADFWTPLQPSTRGEGSGTNYQIIGRLHPGITFAAASGQLTAIMRPVLRRIHLREGRSIEERAVPLETASATDNQKGTNFRQQAILLWSAVGLILLIGCVNIAGLLLSRTAMRRREVTIRLALGANRAIIIRQLLTESLLLAIGGGLLGIFLGQFATQALSYLNADQFDFWNPVHFDARVGFVSFGIALLTGLLFGLVPAFHSTRIDLRAGLAEGGRGTAGNRRHRLQQFLVMAEVALGVMLVISAGLLLRSLNGLIRLDPGFVSQNVTTASVSLNDARYHTTTSGVRLFRNTLDRIRQIPGVESAAVTLTPPYARQLNSYIQQILVPGRSLRPGNGTVNFDYVTPGFFNTLQIPLLRGRAFTEADGPTAQKVAVVNQAFVRQFMPGEANPVGAQLQEGDKTYLKVVGLVKTVAQRGWDTSSRPFALVPEIYIPAAQVSDESFTLLHSWFSPSFVVRTHGHIAGLDHAMQQAIATVDPRLPFSSFKNMDAIRGASLSQQRYLAVLFSTLAGLALLLSAIGVYGLIAQSVAQRTREMGIRLALGASATNIVREAARPGILLSLAGVAFGLLLSFFATRLLASFLWGVSPTDPLTYITVGALLVSVAVLASLIPALRLTRIDPAHVLRDE